MDFLIEYWVEFLFGVFAAGLTAVLSTGYHRLAKKVEEQENVTMKKRIPLIDKCFLIS